MFINFVKQDEGLFCNVDLKVFTYAKLFKLAFSNSFSM